MKTTAMRMLAVCCLLFTGLARGADAPETYAVVSLVGDAMTIVTYRGNTGSNLDRDDRQEIPLGDGVFDQLATHAALDSIHRARPDAAVEEIDVPDHARFGDATALFASDGRLPQLVSAVKPLLKTPDTHYLVVLSKFRGDAIVRVRTGTIGTGKLSGLGFYVDPDKRMTRTATGERGSGFVAPFAYVEVSLIDLRTGAVVRDANATESTMRVNAGSGATLEPWDALTSDQKVRLLENLLGRAVHKTVPRVVAPT
jgi:hypothetical protein